VAIPLDAWFSWGAWSSAMRRARSIAPGLLFFAALTLHPSPAPAIDRFVATTGADAANACSSSISPCATLTHALTQVASGDVIKVARGKYFENLLIDTSGSFSIAGGWSADFAQQDSFTYPTWVDGGGTGDTLTILAGAGETLDVALSSVIIRKGGPDGTGTGIRAETAGDGALALDIVDSQIRENEAAGLAASSDPPGALVVTISDSLVAHNSGPGITIAGVVNQGGVVDLSVSDSTFSFNPAGVSATTAGGTLSFDSVIFENNRQNEICCGAPAGGLRLRSLDSTNVSIDRCTFRRNRKGGAVSLSSSHGLLTATVTNTLMVRNAFGALSAGSYDDGSLDLAIVNSTITRNRQDNYLFGCLGVSHFGSGTTQADVRNSIVYNNRHIDLQNWISTTTLNVDHSDVGVFDGPFNDLGGNVQVNPHVNARGYLDDASPLIDAGTCVGAPTTDFEGDPRPTGAGCDIGADEFVP